MFKKVISYTMIIIITLSLIGCSGKKEEIETQNGKLNVVVSFYAMEEFVKEIGKDKVNVYTIIPEGVEPHDFEPKAKDLRKLENADMLVLNGAGMEHWSKDVIKAVKNEKLKVIDTSQGVNLINISEENGDSSHIGSENTHEILGVNPHLWLGLTTAKIQSENIKNALVELDNANSKYYEENYVAFANELDSLYKDYKVKFDSIANKNFVTGHATFAYLCRDFNLNQISIEGVFAEGEPSPKKMKELTDLCKEKNIKTIFMESLVSPQVSETLAKEVDGKTATIYTLHSKEDNLSYLESMKSNLDIIYNSLK